MNDYDCSNVLVYKLGGTSLDLAVINVIGGMYHLRTSYRDTTVGGHIVDDLLIDHFAVEFLRYLSKFERVLLQLLIDFCKI